jgi:4-amino-4-deoxy-L-arabinose transferase-like glycosyltransferase
VSGNRPFYRATWFLLLLVFLLALSLRLAWIAYANAEPTFDDDTGRYDFWAVNFAHGHDFVNYVSGQPTAFGAPGYAITLGVFYFLIGHSVLGAQLLNALLGAVTILPVFALGRRTAGQSVGLLSAFLVSTFPSQIFFSSLILNEVVFTALFLLILVLLLREGDGKGNRWQLIALGLLLGYATLIRGEMLLMPLVALVFWRLVRGAWRPALRRSLVLVLLMALVLTPWTVRNLVRMKAPVLLTTHSGVTLWIGHHEGADGRFHFADALVYRYPELTTTAREVRVNNDGFREAADFAVHHPLEEVNLFGKKLFWMYARDEEAIVWNEAHGSQPFLSEATRRALLVLSNAYYFAVVALFLAGSAMWLFKPTPAHLLILLTLIYWTLAHIAFIGDARYHFPIMPLVAIGAAAALGLIGNHGYLPWCRDSKETSPPGERI